MKYKRKWLAIFILTFFALIIKFFSINAGNVEQYYSTGIYPGFAAMLRLIFGWIPFSIGDILYGIIFFWLLYLLVKLIRRAVRKDFSRQTFGKTILNMLIVFLAVYIVFYSFWGINYNRKGIASQLGIKNKAYTVEELKTIDSLLLIKANASKTQLLANDRMLTGNAAIFKLSVEAYHAVDSQYKFLNYYPVSVKKSLWGWLGNYVGFLGYYNPFTGEGQVNTTVPKFLLPYVCCHEIAHQVGYAKENEANFVGYLAAAASRDEAFHYSVYLDLFLYANRNLYFTDSVAAKSLSGQLLPSVRKDLFEWRRFNERHVNPVEPVIRWAYGKYLESNEQPSGLLSYDEVTGLLIAYYKKFGKI